MGFILLALVSVAVVACGAVPHYPLYSFYLAQPYPYFQYGHSLPHPAVFAPQPPLQRRRITPVAPDTDVSPVAPIAPAAPVVPVVPDVSPLIHNSITYKYDPEAAPDDALEVAQFHSQDAAGRVVFGFNTPNQSRMEARSLDGTVRGSYSYVDPTGRTVKMHYWDDGTGFHTAGNSLPVSFFSSPGYTPEVQAARERHFQLYKEALAAAIASGSGSETVEAEPKPDDSAVAVEVESADAPETPVKEEADDVNKSDMPDYDADSDAVEIGNDDFTSLRVGPVYRREPEAARKQVAEITDLTLDDSSKIAIAQIGSDGYQRLVPVAERPKDHSESLHATSYGAIPVAAVHDTQVSPVQRENIENHQLKPILIKTGEAKST